MLQKHCSIFKKNSQVFKTYLITLLYTSYQYLLHPYHHYFPTKLTKTRLMQYAIHYFNNFERKKIKWINQGHKQD